MEEFAVTYAIIAVTSLVSFAASGNGRLYEKLMFSIRDIIKGKEYYRVITSALVHAGTGHLIFNMFSFYAFSMGIELRYGHGTVLFIYLLSGLGSSLLTLMIHREEFTYRAVGASGAVSGIIFASIFLIPGGSVIVFPFPVPIPAWAYAVLFVIGSIYAAGRMTGGIAHDAHLGGALIGILTAVAVDYRIATADLPLLGMVLVPIVIFFLFSREIMRLFR